MPISGPVFATRCMWVAGTDHSHPQDSCWKRCKGVFVDHIPIFYPLLLNSLHFRFLHSGQAIGRYSDTAYDSEGGYFASFLLEQPPDPFQGYGEILLKNILPLKGGKGLHPQLDLVIFDHQEIGSYAMMDFVVDFKRNVSAVGEQPLKVTLTWYDPPSIMGSSSSLLIHGTYALIWVKMNTPISKYW